MNHHSCIVALDHADSAVAQRIWSTFQKAYAVEAALLGVDTFPPLARSMSAIQASDTHFWCCEIEGDYAGILEVDTSAANFEICSLAVSPAYFRKGIGLALVSHLLARTVKKSVTVQTARLNSPALLLYKKSGFSEMKSWLSPEGIELVYLERRNK